MQNTIFPGGADRSTVSLLNGAGNRLEGKIQSIQKMNGESRANELKDASCEFEAVFISYMLKVMRETIQESGLMEGGFGKSIYTEMFDQEIAKSLAQRGMLGISDLLYRNLLDSEAGNAAESKVPASDNSENSSPFLTTDPEKKTGENNDGALDPSTMQFPVSGPVSSTFGPRLDPFNKQVRFHKGLDLAAPEGMDVVAAMPGIVLDSGFDKGYGNYVLIQHAENVQTRYGHLGEIYVKQGETVTPDKSLGTVGNTGRSSGPHLHFEVIRMGKPVDPLPAFHSHLAALR